MAILLLFISHLPPDHLLMDGAGPGQSRMLKVVRAGLGSSHLWPGLLAQIPAWPSDQSRTTDSSSVQPEMTQMLSNNKSSECLHPPYPSVNQPLRTSPIREKSPYNWTDSWTESSSDLETFSTVSLCLTLEHFYK